MFDSGIAFICRQVILNQIHVNRYVATYRSGAVTKDGNNVTELRNSNQKKEEITNMCKNNFKGYILEKVLK